MIAPARSAACAGVMSLADPLKYVRAGGLGAPDAVAPFNQVQVQLEDPHLAQLGFEPPRDQELRQLAIRIARRRQIEILRELLRDRRSAAERLGAIPVGLERRADLADVDPLVREERGVLGDDAPRA